MQKREFRPSNIFSVLNLLKLYPFYFGCKELLDDLNPTQILDVFVLNHPSFSKLMEVALQKAKVNIFFTHTTWVVPY